MSLHRQTLSFDVSSSHKSNSHTLQLEDVIKATLDQQIHQHVRATPSLQQTLKARTKRILCTKQASLFAAKWEESEHKEQGIRGGSTTGRSRREWRVNQTKKQLQLLNELYQSMQKNKVKRYCEQIQHQEAQLHMALAQSNFRKTLNTSLKAPKAPHLRQTKTSQLRTEQRNRAKSQKQRDLDMLFQRLSPYRRLQVTRYKGKDLLQPWQVNNLP